MTPYTGNDCLSQSNGNAIDKDSLYEFQESDETKIDHEKLYKELYEEEFLRDLSDWNDENHEQYHFQVKLKARAQKHIVAKQRNVETQR